VYVLPNHVLDAYLSFYLRAFQNSACIVDIDDMARQTSQRRARGTAWGVWRAHVIGSGKVVCCKYQDLSALSSCCANMGAAVSS